MVRFLTEQDFILEGDIFKNSVNTITDPLRGLDITELNNILPDIRRITNNPTLTNVVLANFIMEYGYNISDLTNIVNTRPEDISNQISSFISELEDTITETIDVVCSIVELPATIAARANKLIEKIANFDLEAEIKNFVNKIKDAIVESIRDLINTIKNKINNLINSIKYLFEQATRIAQNTIEWINKKISDIQNFFTEENINSLVDKMTNYINSAIAQFEDLDDDVYNVLSYQFCKSYNQVQETIETQVAPIRDIQANIEQNETILRERSQIRSQIAVTAGRETPTPRSTRATAVEYERRAEREEVVPPIPQVTGRPAPEEWSNLAFSGSVIRNSRNPNGYNNIQIETLQKSNEIAKKLNRKFTINSGYRSPDYNVSIGGAKRSIHMTGKALDVSTVGWSNGEKEEFKRLARLYGFGGLGTYNSFIHIDMGNVRTWRG